MRAANLTNAEAGHAAPSRHRR